MIPELIGGAIGLVIVYFMGRSFRKMDAEKQARRAYWNERWQQEKARIAGMSPEELRAEIEHPRRLAEAEFEARKAEYDPSPTPRKLTFKELRNSRLPSPFGDP